MITGVKHVTIPVADQDRALEFYTKKLGFKLLTDAPMGSDMRWIELEIPDAETRVVLFTAPGQENRIGTPSNIILTTEDIEETHRTLVSNGVKFTTPPTKEFWGTYCLMQDSEGNTFCISQSS